MTWSLERPIRVAVLGAGGLGRAACRLISAKRELQLTAICDSKSALASPEGLDSRSLGAGAGELGASRCDDPIGAVLGHAAWFDALLVTLPNMPNEFIPGVVGRAIDAAPGVVCVDVLKRTRAVELMYELEAGAKRTQSVVLTGCGATPGLLSAAAVLAAQSFIEVERVDIWWGVGIANWEAYKATIREDIAHLPGYTVERAKAMTDADVDALLERTNGLLELRHMEHADDVLLERVGVVQSQDQVEVGGVMDTRHPKKPVSTTMTLTGITLDGKRASHRFILGDDTTMAANVLGPALGYLKRGIWMKQHGLCGVFGSTEFLPMVVR
ncbi:MAG: saccharopine dehydrogenase-like oxidoreductase [Candidatus Omnitrophica bacterium]|nr:saccharopine dehydrogenase-like oxidoreductase [Candidatus Omnitrophota bacterium]